MLLSPLLANAETWVTAVSRNGDRAIVFRYLKDVDSGRLRLEQTQRIIIVWKYKSENGMPTKEEQNQMASLEDAVYPVVTRDKLATLALVSTGENLREWIFYSKSEAGFFTRLNESTKDLPRYPIEVYAAPDSKWESYERFRSGVRE